MGTNYYWHCPIRAKCLTCGHQEPGERLHIGKSSGGWTFSFRAHEDPPLKSYAQWLRWLRQPGGRIVDEYGREHTLEAFMAWVEKKKGEQNNHTLYVRENPALHWCADRCFLDPEGHSFSMGEFS